MSITNPNFEQNANQDLLKGLRKTALIFFIVIGLTHIITGLMVSNDLYVQTTNTINKVLDIPFVFVATFFGLSNFKVSSESKFKSLYFTIFAIICIAVLGLMIFLNLLPDQALT